MSSTLATEFVALAAADAVLDVWEREDVAGHIERIGTLVMSRLSNDLASSRFEVCGLPAMHFLRFQDHDVERRFLLACAARGVLLRRGPYLFPSLAHGEAEVETTLAAAGEAVAEAGA
jgi:adenosylmethionine-8-amino-7-oxononanoate aminotransferase